jgi:hypothetical protein
MISEFFYDLPKVFQTVGVLFIGLYLVIKSTINMIEKKRLNLFLPFFLIGFALCICAGFIFYDFYDLSSDTFFIVKIPSMLLLFHLLRRKIR